MIYVSDIINKFNGKLICGDINLPLVNFSKDTRTINVGDIYVGINGETFDGNTFYKDAMHTALLKGMVNKIYIDDSARKIYFYDGTQYVPIQDSLVTATAEIAGVVKLYDSTGYNTDGTMTQKAITDELDLRYKAEIDSSNELLVFSF